MVDAAVVVALEYAHLWGEMAEPVELVAGDRRGGRFLAGMGEDESVGRAFSGAPSILGRVPNVACFKAFDGLGVDLWGVGEDLCNVVQGRGGGYVSSPLRLRAHFISGVSLLARGCLDG